MLSQPKIGEPHYQEKRAEFQQRWATIRRGREAVELNKKKFRVFIREKQAKIEDGVARCDKEKLLQDQRVRDLKDLKRDFKIHNHAKVLKTYSVSRAFSSAYIYLENA